MSKFFIIKNGKILKSFVRRALAFAFYSDVLDSSNMLFDVVEFWHGDSCLLINNVNADLW